MLEQAIVQPGLQQKRIFYENMSVFLADPFTLFVKDRSYEFVSKAYCALFQKVRQTGQAIAKVFYEPFEIMTDKVGVR